MATLGGHTIENETPVDSRAEPLLEPGDWLSRDEFEQRYERMPHVKKAELIEGIVYIPHLFVSGNMPSLTTSFPAGWPFMYRKPPTPFARITLPSVSTSTMNPSPIWC